MYHYVGLRTGCGRCVWCERWLLGQRCLHVSSHRTAMRYARFVTQDSDVCSFRHTGQRCLHVSSHRTAMPARFVTQDRNIYTFETQDSNACTFRHTGHRCLHVSSHMTGCQTQARVKNRAAIVPFIFVLSFFISFLFLLFIWTVDISTV